MSGFDREKHLRPLLAGGLALFLLCGFWFYSSYQQTLAGLDKKTTATRTELRQLSESLQEYRELAAELQTLSPKTAGNLNLIATVENATQQIGARTQLLSVRPQPDKIREDLIEEGVEIRLEKLQLSQLVELLYQFETANQLLKVAQLRIKTRFDNPEQLDAAMTLSRFKEQR